MSEAVLSLALVSHHEDENNPTTSGASDSPADKKKAPSLWAAVARALYGSLAFLYRAPLRMFRPTKISISLGLQALLNEQGKKSLTPSVVRGIIRKEGVSVSASTRCTCLSSFQAETVLACLLVAILSEACAATRAGQCSHWLHTVCNVCLIGGVLQEPLVRPVTGLASNRPAIHLRLPSGWSTISLVGSS